MSIIALAGAQPLGRGRGFAATLSLGSLRHRTGPPALATGPRDSRQPWGNQPGLGLLMHPAPSSRSTGLGPAAGSTLSPVAGR